MVVGQNFQELNFDDIIPREPSLLPPPPSPSSPLPPLQTLILVEGEEGGEVWGGEGERVVGFSVEDKKMVGMVEVGETVVLLENYFGMVIFL